MSRRKLFMLALYAMKPDPNRVEITSNPDGSYHWKMKDGLKAVDQFAPVAMLAAMACAESEEEAYNFGVSIILEQYPVENGWINHHATLNPISIEAISKVIQVISHDTDEEDEHEQPDLIM
jgi:hypothetical protein